MDEGSPLDQLTVSQASEKESYDRAHPGCFAGFVVALVSVLLTPFILLHFGWPAFVLLPILPLLWLLAMITPWVNPLEKAPAAVQWIGRILVWLLLCWFAWRGLFFIYGSVLMNTLQS